MVLMGGQLWTERFFEEFERRTFDELDGVRYSEQRALHPVK